MTMQGRQGVFAFLFKCPACRAEFVTLSWREHRPAEVAIGCPECQSGVDFLGTVPLSWRQEFALPPQPKMGPDGTPDESAEWPSLLDTGRVEIYAVGQILSRAAEPGAWAIAEAKNPPPTA